MIDIAEIEHFLFFIWNNDIEIQKKKTETH